MGMMTSDSLSSFFHEGFTETLHIKKIVETADSIYLGAVGLSRSQPLFHSILGFAFSGVLSDDAYFYLIPVKAEVEGRNGLAAVFRQFESSQYQDHPEDILAGWVAPKEAPLLEAWVARMNQQLASLLAIKHHLSEANTK
jgi:hypothetical protein